ncbi:MAG TPA: hypothetical protein H9753_12635, partial [Candidatus Blautia merdavium]|nr:hypothetical protein [Candidatus Blautia merdavium]
DPDPDRRADPVEKGGEERSGDCSADGIDWTKRKIYAIILLKAYGKKEKYAGEIPHRRKK